MSLTVEDTFVDMEPAYTASKLHERHFSCRTSLGLESRPCTYLKWGNIRCNYYGTPLIQGTLRIFLALFQGTLEAVIIFCVPVIRVNTVSRVVCLRLRYSVPTHASNAQLFLCILYSGESQS